MRWAMSWPRGSLEDRRAWRWTGVLALGVLLGVVWASSYVAGGAVTPWPHLFAAPILLAGLLFGLRGGVVAALAATVLSGPLLPLDVATGEGQAWGHWLTRGHLFAVLGILAGAMLHHLRRSYERDLSEQLQREMHVATSTDGSFDPVAFTRIGEMLRSRAFHTVFQPIYSLHDGRLLAVEALSRFETEPVRPPNVWFDEAASVGLGTELELLAAETALASSAPLPEEVAVTLNGSPDLLCEPRFLSLVERHPERRLVVEVTEHAVVEDYTRLAEAIAVLRAQGVQLAIDDAGAGFSSLQHIVRLTPDIIKLDLSLTQHLHDDPVRRALADCLVRFARETGCELIAEGIEHPNDLHTWSELGAHAAQGYLLGRPGPLPVADSSMAVNTPASRALRHPRVSA
jgi:EAL domain-containing protein (putative c-di-GMP-specific phosphodiesterase class I)